MAVLVRGSIAGHLGSSLEAEAAATGWNAGWAAEFEAQAKGLERTFTFEILGFGGTMATLSRFLDNDALNPTLAVAAGAYITMWVFLSGGILDRLARGRPVRTGAFFSACGRLAVPSSRRSSSSSRLGAVPEAAPTCSGRLAGDTRHDQRGAMRSHFEVP
jgi:hypothetical protein